MIFLKLLNIIKIIKIFIWNVFKLYRLSDIIISDHENQFLAIFLKILCMWLEIDLQFSTACHFETDNQIKNANIIMK